MFMNVIKVQASLVINPQTDYDCVVDFYCRVLGLFEMADDVMRLRADPTFTIGTVGFGGKLPVGVQTGSWAWLMFIVDDIDEIRRRLIEQDQKIELLDLPYGRQLMCADPVGNRLAFFEEPVRGNSKVTDDSHRRYK